MGAPSEERGFASNAITDTSRARRVPRSQQPVPRRRRPVDRDGHRAARRRHAASGRRGRHQRPHTRGELRNPIEAGPRHDRLGQPGPARRRHRAGSRNDARRPRQRDRCGRTRPGRLGRPPGRTARRRARGRRERCSRPVGRPRAAGPTRGRQADRRGARRGRARCVGILRFHAQSALSANGRSFPPSPGAALLFERRVVREVCAPDHSDAPPPGSARRGLRAQFGSPYFVS